MLTMRRRLMLLALLAFVLVLVSILVVMLVTGEDDPFPGPDRPVATTVDQIVDVESRLFRRLVTVDAPAVALDNGMLVLRGEQRSIIVQPEPGSIRGEVSTNEVVTVTGVVDTLSRLQVGELRELSRGDQPEALRRAPTQLGDPLISAGSVDAT